MTTIYTLMPDHNHHAAQIILQQDGTFAPDWYFVDALMSPAEREAYAEFEASMVGHEEPEGYGPPPPRFAQFDDCLEYIRTVNWGHQIAFELDAYHAPSECTAKAYEAQDRAYEAALAKALPNHITA